MSTKQLRQTKSQECSEQDHKSHWHSTQAIACSTHQKWQSFSRNSMGIHWRANWIEAQTPRNSSLEQTIPHTFKAQSSAWKRIAMSMQHWRNDATQPWRGQTLGLVLPRIWSSQKEWTNQIRDQFLESQSSAWAMRVPSHASRRDFSVGLKLCVCHKPWLEHGIPPHQPGSVSL